MKKLRDETDRTHEQVEFEDVEDIDAEAPLWVLLPKMLFSVVTSFALTVLVFWLDDGEVSMFSFGFATFLVTLQVLMLIGFRFQQRTDLHTTKQPGNKLFDRIGGLWLAACAFGAFFGWVSGNMALMFPAHKTLFFMATVLFSIVLPIATMLPNLRYINGRAFYIQVPLLTLVTILPTLVGFHYMLNFRMS